MIKQCEQCSKEFVTYQSKILLGKGKFCSKECSNYCLPKVQRNCDVCAKTFLVSDTPSRKNRGKHCSRKCYEIFKKTDFLSQNNHKWKGDKVGYRGLHGWVSRRLGKPNKCEHCGDISKRKYEWANKSHKYLRDINDWIRLCVPCHKKYDCRLIDN